MRIVAIIATYNEERFIGGCLEHLRSQGIEAYLCDNGSTDETVAIASHSLGHGLLAIEQLPRDETFRWRGILARKEELAAELDADWFLHLDADEIPLPPPGQPALNAAFAAVDAEGYNAVEFAELTFVPTRELPDHDHADFRRTMRWYYPFLPTPLHLVRAWKRQRTRIELARSGGHVAKFPGWRLCPDRFRLRHYLFLSVEHARRKYQLKRYDPAEVRDGWHGWRPAMRVETLTLPTSAELRFARSDSDLDVTAPRTEHCFSWRR